MNILFFLTPKAMCAYIEAGDTLRQAIDKAYEQAAKVHFENAYCRKDIGQRALAAGEEK